MAGMPPGSEEAYPAHLQRARAVRNWRDMELLNTIKITRTADGGAVVMVAAARVDVKKVDPQRFVLYVINLLDSVVNEPYVVLYSHYAASATNRPDVGFLQHVKEVLDKRYKVILSHPLFALLFVLLNLPHNLLLTRSALPFTCGNASCLLLGWATDLTPQHG